MKQDLITEVKAVRASNNGVDIDVSAIAAKYILAGVRQDEVEHYLTGLGFKIYPQPPKTDGTQTLVAILRHRQTPISHDQVRLLVVLSKGVVSSVSGRLRFQSI